MNHTCNLDRLITCGLPGCTEMKCVQCIKDHYIHCKYNQPQLFSSCINKQLPSLSAELESKHGSSTEADSERSAEGMCHLAQSIQKSAE